MIFCLEKTLPRGLSISASEKETWNIFGPKEVFRIILKRAFEFRFKVLGVLEIIDFAH